MKLGIQHPVSLVKIQGPLSEHSQGQPRLLQQDVGIGSPIDTLQRRIVFIQPFIGGLLQTGLNLICLGRNTGLYIILFTQPAV